MRSTMSITQFRTVTLLVIHANQKILTVKTLEARAPWEALARRGNRHHRVRRTSGIYPI